MENDAKLPKGVFALYGVICGCFLLCALAPFLIVNAHRLLWEIRKPAKYYIVVDLYDGGRAFEKGICVKDGKQVASELLSGEEFNGPLEKDYAMTAFFDLVRRCNPIDVIDCQVQFDSYYHYPSRVEVYEGYVFTIESFLADEDAESMCPDFTN
ncbi:MAG: hypothetical protein JW963_14045 [Anaerolineales bacterium]|nr:hypothetical protein [Anaerolineales bacterium]